MALKSAVGAAVPGAAETAETMSAGNAPAATTAPEGLLRAGGWRYSSSTVSFYFCTDVRYPQLRHHNVFLGPPEVSSPLRPQLRPAPRGLCLPAYGTASATSPTARGANAGVGRPLRRLAVRAVGQPDRLRPDALLRPRPSADRPERSRAADR